MAGALPPEMLQEYRENASGQLKRLAGFADRLAASGDDLEVLTELSHEVHKIRGAAGSYGYRSASRLAAGMDETVKDWLAQPHDNASDRVHVVRWFVTLLADALQLEAPPVDADQGPPPAAAAAPPGALRGETEIILVEDDPALAALLEYGLRSRGYRFVTYRNGREALDAMLSLPPGDQAPLVLLDVDLPALDGYSIFAALQQERPGQFRVVFTTVHGDESAQLRGLEAGALDYLVKPISLRVALEKIRRWIGR
jgi:CheY-like chemotaxis protein